MYDRVPLNTPDEWDDIESFRESVHRHPRSVVEDSDPR
jgi:hypothetical protein